MAGNKKSANLTTYRRKESRLAWLFSTPAIILLIVFLIIPFVWAIWMSFTNMRLIPNPNVPTKFIGLENYIRLLTDDVFHKGLLNNFYFVLVVVPIQTSFALGLAMLINQELKGMNLFRTVYFSPVVTSMTVVSIVWTLLYNPDEGLINAFLQAISFGKLGPYNWLTNTKLVFPAIMLMSIWQGVGFQMVIFLAGLQEIPSSLYEAAEVDGANAWQKFINITIPQLRNTLIFVIISTTILAFRLFDQVKVMTNGGPSNASMTTMLYAIETGWGRLKIGYASAVTVVFFLIVLLVSMAQRVLTREKGAKKNG
ncbi:MAG: sugar ABC transporter permease [Anaerolineaceae bacterium]|nr:sugar ABC transporter permease [Anaerolineaceae bacterium]